MKVLVTVVYDAKDEAEASEVSKRFPAIPGVMYTRDNFTVFDRNALLAAAEAAALAQYRAHIHSACVPSQNGQSLAEKFQSKFDMTIGEAATAYCGADEAEKTVQVPVSGSYFRTLKLGDGPVASLVKQNVTRRLGYRPLRDDVDRPDHTLDDVSAKNIRKVFE